MPGYVKTILTEFAHEMPRRPVQAPSKYKPFKFGKEGQKIELPKNLPRLSEKSIKQIQQILRKFLYYGRAVNPTLAHALNDLATKTPNATAEQTNALNHLLNYAATHPDATIRYHASEMILHIHSDASYLTAKNVHSRAGDNFFLSNQDTSNTVYNHPVHLIAKTLRNVISSAAEAELAALF